MSRSALVLALALLCSFAAVQGSLPFPRTRPYVIGHRGECGVYPDHTMASYQQAITDGADFIECDIVLTKDLVPICRHEPLLSGTTDANDKFPAFANTTYTIDGYNYTGVFSTDLTLAQVKTLRAKQPLPERNQSYNGLFEIPTLEEYIQLALGSGRTVGIYPETKHPTWHDNLQVVKTAGTSITKIALQVLQEHGYTGPLNSKAWLRQPVFVQSFETTNLKWLSRRSCMPLIQLMDDLTAGVPDLPGTTYGDLMDGQQLDEIAKYASGIGPWKNTLLIAKANATNTLNGAGLVSTGLVARAHKRGLQVHLYTLRDEAYRLTYGNFSSPWNEYDRYFAQEGVDGGFTDFSRTLKGYMDNKKVAEAGRKWDTHNLNRRASKKSGNPNKC